MEIIIFMFLSSFSFLLFFLLTIENQALIAQDLYIYSKFMWQKVWKTMLLKGNG